MTDILTPVTEEEAADIVRECSTSKTALQVAGGNTRAGFGNSVAADANLSSLGLSGIVSYTAAEMVMTVRAGTAVSVIQAALAENRQMMAFEPMDHRGIMGTTGEPTIGGILPPTSPVRVVMWRAQRATVCLAHVSSTVRERSSRPVAGS